MPFTIFPPFFEGNEYFIDEKVNFFKFENAYRVYDGQGNQTGNIVQRLAAGQKLLRLLISKKMMPFVLEIKDMNGEVITTIRRGWTFWLSKISILDNDGAPVGYIQQKFAFLRPSFRIFDASDNQLATITGDWKAWNFAIRDGQEREIGTINKKWAGAIKEIFTTADKYRVSIVPEYAEDRTKIAIVAAAITIDMVLKEGGNN